MCNRNQPRMNRPAQPRKAPKAMTLVEVVLALGIVSFAIIPLIGLLGVGLKSNTSANDETAHACILAFMQSELRTRVYSANAWTSASNTASHILTNPASARSYYFDAQGSWVASCAAGATPSGAAATRALYQATCTNGTALTPGAIRYNISIKWPYPGYGRSRDLPATVFNYE